MDFTAIKNHVLLQIKNTNVTKYPYYDMFIENIFPKEFYNILKQHMLDCKYRRSHQDRNWDNPEYVNKRYDLSQVNDNEVDIVKKIFLNDDIKKALLGKFYVTTEHHDRITFFKDIQYVFTERDRYQVIHTDMPEQFLSLVFYIPECEDDQLDDITKLNNGTTTYDKNLNPHKLSKYINNSMFCFAPHFYSYHGFNTTIPNRNTMLFFYSDEEAINKFYNFVNNSTKGQKYNEEYINHVSVCTFKERMLDKLLKYKLIEYNDSEISKEIKENNDCRINELNGRVTI